MYAAVLVAYKSSRIIRKQHGVRKLDTLPRRMLQFAPDNPSRAVGEAYESKLQLGERNRSNLLTIGISALAKPTLSD